MFRSGSGNIQHNIRLTLKIRNKKTYWKNINSRLNLDLGTMLYSRLVEPSRHGTDKATSRD